MIKFSRNELERRSGTSSWRSTTSDWRSTTLIKRKRGAPVAQLFNQSVAEGTVPRQWRTAIIKPIPKVSKPTQPGDYRPISITSVLSRTLERAIVRKAIYPALLQPLPPAIDFDDQFAYRPTGSTTATIIAMLHTVRTMLSANPYVRILSFDFSKAFDSVSHAPLIDVEVG